MDKKPILTGRDVVAVLCGAWLARRANFEDLKITGVSSSNGRFGKGDLVFFTEPPLQDGGSPSRLLEQLSAIYDKGAALVVLDRMPQTLTLPESRAYLRVPNVMAAMFELARYSRNRFQGKTVAVTGSVGKTTVSSMLHQLLSRQCSTHYKSGNWNTTSAIALSCCSLPADFDFAVFEVAAHKAKKARINTRLVRPWVAVFTELYLQHLNDFGTLEEIADAKSILFEGVRPGGAVVLNRDMEMFDYVREQAAAKTKSKIVTYGACAGANVRLLTHELRPRESFVAVSVDGTELQYRLSLPGYHNVRNSMAALAACHVLGLDMNRSAESMGSLEQIPGRTQHLEFPATGGGSIEVIYDSFNACPASMEAAFALLSLKVRRHKGRKIAILSDMGALGERSEELHAELAQGIARYDIDAIYTIGTDIRHFYDALPATMDKRHYAEDDDRIVADLSNELAAGDIVIFKGSNTSAVNNLDVIRRLHAMNRKTER